MNRISKIENAGGRVNMKLESFHIAGKSGLQESSPRALVSAPRKRHQRSSDLKKPFSFLVSNLKAHEKISFFRRSQNAKAFCAKEKRLRKRKKN